VRAGRNLLASAFIAVLFWSGCSRAPESSPVITIAHAISPQPARVGPVTVTLQLADAAAKPIAGARIALEADMSHAGMSPVFGEAKEVAPGQYQSQVRLGMAGDWVILLHATLPGGKKLERQFDVRDVRPN
jgi:YtkA-like